MNPTELRLVVIPSDPLWEYERKGLSPMLEAYYNPQHLFDSVFALSPFEQGERRAYGMTVRGVPESQFARALAEIRPHVVRAYGGFWPANLACRRRIPRTPVMVSVHDTNPGLLYGGIRHADLVVCMSRAVERLVLNHGVAGEKVRVLPNRVDLGLFRRATDPAAYAALSRRFPGGKHLLAVGRLCPQKNLDTVIKALALLPADYHCVFIGQGERAPYEELARACGVADRCAWVEHVSNLELPLWYSWCDCMCMPSRWEGFGIAFLEAAACGAAIVTSDLAPMNEYLAHDQSACLVKAYEDPAAIAAAVRRVTEDRAYRQHLVAGAIAAAQPFDRHTVDAVEANLYRELMAMPPRPIRERLARFAWAKRDLLGNWARQTAQSMRTWSRRAA